MIKNLSIGGSNRTMLMLALVFGVACAVLVGIYLSQLSGDEGSSVSTTTLPVVVANQDIPPQTTITEAMVALKDVPTDFVLTGGFADVTQVVGKKAQVQLVSGQQLLISNAIDADTAAAQYGADAPLSLLIPEGKRAFAIYVSPVAAAGGLTRSGDHIDIVVSSMTSATSDTGTDETTASACYALQDIEVLAVGSILKTPAAEGDSTAIAGVDPNVEATSMTLAVTNSEAIQLASAQQSVSAASVGRQLWVALRAFGDHTPNTDLPTCAIGA